MNDLTLLNETKNALNASDDHGQYLTFLVDNENLAININDVNEIIEIRNMTTVPMTPGYIRGVINLRGNVVPVIDLSVRLGRKTSEIGKRSCIVLVEVMANGEAQNLGMLVDQVNAILEIPAENIQPPPEFGADIKTEFIQAMGRVDDNFIILLEISRVLSISELSQLSKISQPANTLTTEEILVED